MKYAKALVAVLAAGLTVLVSVMSDGAVSTTEWVQVAIAVVSAIGVYVVPNIPEFPYTKTIVASLLAGLNLVVAALSDGTISQSEWVNIGLAILAAAGVYKIANASGGDEDGLDVEGALDAAA